MLIKSLKERIMSMAVLGIFLASSLLTSPVLAGLTANKVQVSAAEEIWLDGNGISVKVDNRGALAVYMVDSTGVKTAVTKPAETAALSGYVNVSGVKVTDFTKVSNSLEQNVPVTLGTGKRLTVVSRSASKALTRTLVMEVADSNPGVIYNTTRYKSEAGNLNVDSFVENEFTLDLGSGPFLAYQGCADGQGSNTIVSVGDGYSHNNTHGPLSAGVPFSYVYNAKGGLGVGDTSTVRREYTTPIIGASGTVSMAIKWNGKTLSTNVDTIIGTSTIVATTGDYYTGLKSYSQVMGKRGIAAPTDIPEISYDHRWESWGYEFAFTAEGIIAKLDEIKSMGITQVTLDDGWYNKNGDWDLNTSKFANDAAMKYLTDQIHSKGMTAILWWRPVDGGTNSSLVTAHPDWFVRNASGNMVRLPGPGGGSGGTAGYALCPSVPAALEHHKAFVRKALSTWGFDGIKQDYVWGMPKCYAAGHNHARPDESMEQQYKFYKAVYDESKAVKSNAFVELCNCGTPQDYYSIPYVNHMPTADPTSVVQTRTRIKAFKAIYGDNFPVTTDHNSVWLPSALGTGSVMVTKFTTLSDAQKAEFTKFFKLGESLQLEKGQFIGNLYKYGIDPLETYVVKKDSTMYYSFYKDNSTYTGNIEIRGLDSSKTYKIEDYVNNTVIATGVKGPNATINTSFSNYLLVRAVPETTPATNLTIGTNSILTSNDSGNSSYLNAFSCTLAQTSTIESLSIYVGNNPDGGKVRLGIYDDNAGRPGNLKAYTDEFIATPNAWNTKNVVSPVQLVSGKYWLAFQPDKDTLSTKTNPSSSKVSVNVNPRTYGALPVTFPTGTGFQTYNGDCSLYATLSISDSVIPQTSWKLKYTDSQETAGENGAAINAFDGKNTTIWHTKYSGGIAPLPHEIQIDLGAIYDLSKFSYLPRQDGVTNGTIKDYEFYVSADGTNWGTAVASGTFVANNTEKTVEFARKTGRYIRLRALSEISGKQFTTVADIKAYGKFIADPLIPQTTWSLKYTDSQETAGENGAATRAFDGNNSTMWHTKYSGGIAALPHEIQIDLGAIYDLSKFSYLPRQDGGTNGTIKNYEFYISADGTNWGTAVASGAFAANNTEKSVEVTRKTGRYIRLRALSEINGTQYTTAADIKVYGKFVSAIPAQEPLTHAATYLNIPTYDGTNQSTHPDVVYFLNGWNGHKYWMVMTPNRLGSSVAENPSILVSEDGINWSVPAGVTNPIAAMPSVGHNCDVDMIYNQATNELWIYYIESDDKVSGWVKFLKSGDGIHWTAPMTVVDDRRAMYSTLSPSIVYKDNKYYMWSANAGNSGWNNQNNKVEMRESLDGINWSAPVVLTGFVQPGNQIWHVDVRYIPSKAEYWAIFPAYVNGTGSNNTMLYYGKSKDGINWTMYGKPVLDKGDPGTWDDMEIYRSCFIYEPETDKIRVWYSGISNQPQIWKIGYTENNYTDFLNALTN